jgi:hypothetical protein
MEDNEKEWKTTNGMEDKKPEWKTTEWWNARPMLGAAHLSPTGVCFKCPHDVLEL